MRKKLLAAAAALILIMEPGAVYAGGGMGVTRAVFLTQMGVAYGRVKWGYSVERIEEEMLATPEGNYVAEYNDSIALFVNMQNKDRVKNAALSFVISDGEVFPGSSRAALPDGEEQYEGVCTQLILATNLNMTEKRARAILTELGLFGPVLDGRQRCVRDGRFVYIMKLHKTGAVILVVSTL